MAPCCRGRRNPRGRPVETEVMMSFICSVARRGAGTPERAINYCAEREGRSAKLHTDEARQRETVSQLDLTPFEHAVTVCAPVSMASLANHFFQSDLCHPRAQQMTLQRLLSRAILATPSKTLSCCLEPLDLSSNAATQPNSWHYVPQRAVSPCGFLPRSCYVAAHATLQDE